MMNNIVVNQSPIDRFSVAHFAWGMAMAKLQFKPVQAVFTAVSFEVMEDVMKKKYPSAFPNPSLDSKENALIDILFSMAGFGFGRRF